MNQKPKEAVDFARDAKASAINGIKALQASAKILSAQAEKRKQVEEEALEKKLESQQKLQNMQESGNPFAQYTLKCIDIF